MDTHTPHIYTYLQAHYYCTSSMNFLQNYWTSLAKYQPLNHSKSKFEVSAVTCDTVTHRLSMSDFIISDFVSQLHIKTFQTSLQARFTIIYFYFRFSYQYQQKQMEVEGRCEFFVVSHYYLICLTISQGNTGQLNCPGADALIMRRGPQTYLLL